MNRANYQSLNTKSWNFDSSKTASIGSTNTDTTTGASAADTTSTVKPTPVVTASFSLTLPVVTDGIMVG